MRRKVSVCIAAYNGAKTITGTIKSILAQTFKNFELVIVDDGSTDNTVEIVKTFRDKRVKLYQNKKNQGCGGNLTVCKKKAKGEILFYVCQDDFVDKYALEKVYRTFGRADDIGIVTRPYLFFADDISKPVRITRQFKRDQIVSIKSDYKKITDVIALADQISGIGLRKKYMETSFGKDPFIEMASMVLPMLKRCRAVILKENIIGVTISISGSQNPKVYQNSPMMVWRNLISKTFFERKFKGLRQYLDHNFVANNYVGLIQIKNYGTYEQLFREIYYLLKWRPQNLFSLKFWFFSLGTIIVPKVLLKKMVHFYHYEISKRLLESLNVKFHLDFRPDFSQLKS